MKRSYLAVFSVCMTILLVLAGCVGTGQGGPADGNTSGDDGEGGKDTLIVAANAGPVDLDPHGTTDQNTYDVRYQIYESLVRAGVSGEILPALATDWEWEDNNTINFTLREGVVFQNGSSFDGEDVLYSIQRASQSSFTSSYLENVIVDECTVLDDGRVQFKLETPVSAFLSRMSMVMMIDKETWESSSEDEMLENPVGTGPYKLVQWVQGDRLEFTAHNDYWEGLPYFTNVVLRIIPESSARALEIEAGTVDIALQVQASDVDTLEADSNIELHSTPSYMITYMGFDCNVEPYSDPLVRQALSYALDKEAICEIVYAGLGQPALHGRLSEVYWGYTEDTATYDYNPERARELLAEAGYADGFSMSLSLSEAEQDQIDMSEIIQSQLGDVGISVTIDIIENATFLNTIVDGGFDVFLLNSTGSSADPGEATKSFISTRPTWSNTTRYYNDDLTALIEKGQATIDDAEKLEIFTEVQQIVAEECPWVFIVHNTTTFATRSNIQGLVPYPSTAHLFKEAYLA